MKHNFLNDRILYKYFKINNDNLNALYEGKIWFSHPSKFNDPFDANLRILGENEEDFQILDHVYNYLADENEYYKENLSPDHLKVHLGHWENDDPNQAVPPAFTETFDFALRNTSRDPEDLVKYLRDNMSEYNSIKSFLATYSGLGISSFATEPHDPKMWATYGDNHTGICVKYCLRADEFNQQSEIYCSSVDYKDGPHEFLASSGALNLESILNQLSLKSRDWVNEKEVRLISLSKPNKLFSPPGLSLVGLCFGLSVKANDRKVVTNLLHKKNPDLNIYKARLNDRYLKIDWENLAGGFEEDITYKPLLETAKK